MKNEQKEVLGQQREYLTIQILHNDMTVMVPSRTPTARACARSSSEETVDEVLDVLRDDGTQMPKNWSRRYKHNRDKLKTGDIFEVAEVVRNLAIRHLDKGLSTGEKQMFSRAKKILASELMYARDMDEEEATEFLENLLEDIGGSRVPTRGRHGPRVGGGAGRVAGPAGGHRGRGGPSRDGGYSQRNGPRNRTCRGLTPAAQLEPPRTRVAEPRADRSLFEPAVVLALLGGPRRVPGRRVAAPAQWLGALAVRRLDGDRRRRGAGRATCSAALFGRWLRDRLGALDRAADRRSAAELTVGALGLVVGLRGRGAGRRGRRPAARSSGRTCCCRSCCWWPTCSAASAARKHVDILRAGGHPLASAPCRRVPTRLIDTSAIIDGRLVDVVAHQVPLGRDRGARLRARRAAARGRLERSALKRARGRRGLEMVEELKADANGGFSVREARLSRTLEGVDAKLVRMAQEMGALDRHDRLQPQQGRPDPGRRGAERQRAGERAQAGGAARRAAPGQGDPRGPRVRPGRRLPRRRHDDRGRGRPGARWARRSTSR